MTPPTQPRMLVVRTATPALSATRGLLTALVVLAVPIGGGCSAGPVGSAESATRVAPREGTIVGDGGTELYYRIAGTGLDTVVVVHGGPGAGMGSVWPEFEPLAERLALVFYDQRGGGRSGLPDDTSRLHADHFVADLDSVRSHFSLERMKLLAHSFGSILAARYAREHPGRVERIALHGATGPVRAEAARLARARAATPPAADTALARRGNELLGSLLDGSAPDPVAVCREWESIGRRLAADRGETTAWRGSTCEMPPEALLYYYEHTAQHAPRTFGNWDFRGELEEVSAPVLVVAGTRDTLDLEAQRTWAEAYPNGRLLAFDAFGKTAIADRPEAVVPALTAFLEARVDTVVRSDRWPPAAVAVDSAFEYLGTRAIDLGGAEAEIHVLADVSEDGELQRFYWIQFEGRKPESPGRYDYSSLPHRDTIDGYEFFTDVRHGAYTRDEVKDEADTRTVAAILAEHGHDFPAPMMRVRMATLDEERRNELLVVYMERLAWSGLSEDELAADEAAWARAAAGLRERATGGLGLVAE